MGIDSNFATPKKSSLDGPTVRPVPSPSSFITCFTIKRASDPRRDPVLRDSILAITSTILALIFVSVGLVFRLLLFPIPASTFFEF